MPRGMISMAKTTKGFNFIKIKTMSNSFEDKKVVIAKKIKSLPHNGIIFEDDFMIIRK